MRQKLLNYITIIISIIFYNIIFFYSPIMLFAGEAEDITPATNKKSPYISNFPKPKAIFKEPEFTLSFKPKAVFKEPEFTFQPVQDGTKVLHDFVGKNIGNEILIIKKVKTSCGCTAVKYDKEIQAGEQSRIRVSVDTTGFLNKTISKSINVYTNDPDNSIKELKISGSVETIVNISPKNVRLSGKIFPNFDNNIEMSVKVIPSPKYPFNIKSLKLSEGVNIDAHFKRSDSMNGSWEIKVTNIREKAGRYFDQITLKTDSSIVPEIKINVFGNIKD